jgi:hypothetical protein
MRRIAWIVSLVLIFGAGIASLSACDLLPFWVNGSELFAYQQSASERLGELRRMIEQEIGAPHANEPSQCKLIGFGSKPCGGPWSYLIYSTAKTDESRLKQLVSEFNQLQKRINEERKFVSDCAITPEPKVEFVDGVCTAKPN